MHLKMLNMEKKLPIALALLTSMLYLQCQRSRPTIMGLPCYQKGEGTKVKKLTNNQMTNYQKLKDSVFRLPHAALHRCLEAPQSQTYVGIYTDDSFKTVQQKFKSHPLIRKQRTDTLGFHGLLRSKGDLGYIFLTKGRAGPVLFLTQGATSQKTQALFENRNYYASKLECP